MRRQHFSSPSDNFSLIRKDPKPASKLFTFSSFSQIVLFFKHFHKQHMCVTVAVGKSVPRYEPTWLRDWLPFPLRKKVNSGIIYDFWTKLELRSLGDFHAIASISLNRRSNWRPSRSKIVFQQSQDYLFVCLWLNLGFPAHFKKRRTDATAFKSSGQFNEMQLANARYLISRQNY